VLPTAQDFDHENGMELGEKFLSHFPHTWFN